MILRSKGAFIKHTIASEEDQVGPRDLVAALLLDGPQQAASLVK